MAPPFMVLFAWQPPSKPAVMAAVANSKVDLEINCCTIFISSVV
jgi:hypothetical protein